MQVKDVSGKGHFVYKIIFTAGVRHFVHGKMMDAFFMPFVVL